MVFSLGRLIIAYLLGAPLARLLRLPVVMTFSHLGLSPPLYMYRLPLMAVASSILATLANTTRASASILIARTAGVVAGAGTRAAGILAAAADAHAIGRGVPYLEC
jgi:hypothetical protein